MAGRAGEALRTLLLAGAAVLVALALAEGLVRALDLGPAFHVVFRDTVQPSDDPALGYELRPGARDGPHRINRLGLRDAEPTPRRPGTLRIVAIGDSVTYGSGVPREAGWTEQLERLLAHGDAADARVEVWNLGVPGYNATQVVARLQRDGAPLEPDAVVYGYVLNDPQAYSLEAAALARMRAEARARAGAAPGSGAIARLLARSRLYPWVRHIVLTRRDARRRPDAMPDDPAYAAARSGDAAAYLRALHEDARSWSRVEEALDALAAFARERGVPVLVAVFPMLPAAGEGDRLDDVRAQVLAAARARGLHALDLAAAYRSARGAGRAEIDFLHPNAWGHRIAAEALAAALCAGELLPRPVSGCTALARGGSAHTGP